MTETTLPEFNPSKDTRVDDIKAATEELMKMVRFFSGDERCKAIAITHFETGCMFAVKSLFVK